MSPNLPLPCYRAPLSEFGEGLDGHGSIDTEMPRASGSARWTGGGDCLETGEANEAVRPVQPLSVDGEGRAAAGVRFSRLHTGGVR